MTTVEQWLMALALTESNDNPEAWGDGGRAMGRWQVHPARLWSAMHTYLLSPQLGDTWDQLVERVLRRMFARWNESKGPVWLAMYWHLGHMVDPDMPDWDAHYAANFAAALVRAKQELP